MQSEENTEGLEDATPAVEPPEIKAVSDGTDFIKRKRAQGLPSLTPVVIDGQQFFIRKAGAHEVGEVFRGEWKDVKIDGEEKKVFDALATGTRMQMVTICKCVVSEDREPLWRESQVLTMFSGPDAEIFSDLLMQLYGKCIEVNHFFHPRWQPNATKLLFEWF